MEKGLFEPKRGFLSPKLSIRCSRHVENPQTALPPPHGSPETCTGPLLPQHLLRDDGDGVLCKVLECRGNTRVESHIPNPLDVGAGRSSPHPPLSPTSVQAFAARRVETGGMKGLPLTSREH